MGNGLAARIGHTAVWTGSEMIIWGGADGGAAFNTGGRYNPATDTWAPISMTNAPFGRYYHTAVWTGEEMIVWGGLNQNHANLNTGGRYNPSTDSWTTTTATNAPGARALHTAVWTGSEMIEVNPRYVVDVSARPMRSRPSANISVFTPMPIRK